MSKQDTGNYGEHLACEYLKKLGYKILERNFRIRGGEIDIVAKDGDYLVFVEVKARYSHEYGLPVDSITSWKVKALIKSAAFYVQNVKWGGKPYRLDMVSVDFVDRQKDNPNMEVYKNITDY